MLDAICGAVTVIWIFALRRAGPLCAWAERRCYEHGVRPAIVLSVILFYTGLAQLLLNIGFHLPLSETLSMLTYAFLFIPHEGGKFWAGITSSIIINRAAGSLAQTLIPLAFAAVAYRKAWYIASSIALWFTSLNIGYVAWYILDAKVKSRSLTCLECSFGGPEPPHDMSELLTHAGLLEYYKPLGYVVFFVAMLIFLVSVWLPHAAPSKEGDI